MKIRALLAAAFAAIGLAFAAAPPAESTPPATTIQHTCSSRYTHAVLSWGHKCLAAGQFCKRSADREYHRYRFHCHSRDASGNYHLTR